MKPNTIEWYTTQHPDNPYPYEEDELEAVKTAFTVEPGDTLWSVIHAVMRAGNDAALAVDSREKLQRIGGRILELAERGSRWID